MENQTEPQTEPQSHPANEHIAVDIIKEDGTRKKVVIVTQEEL